MQRNANLLNKLLKKDEIECEACWTSKLFFDTIE